MRRAMYRLPGPALRALQVLAAALASIGTFVVTLARPPSTSRSERIPRALGRALVAFCGRAGATYIKVGQIASTRSDLLPAALVDELAALQDQVPPFPFEQVREIVENDLGQDLESIFESFDPLPVAAASVAQVHRAVLRKGGVVVAVKVRRPGLVEKLEVDRRILLAVGRALERLFPTLRLIAVEGALETFCTAVRAQIHLMQEAHNNQRFQRNFADDPGIRFPQIYPDACSDAVLTMDFVEGLHESQLADSACDLRAIVETGMRCVCRMIFLHGFTHADLHPGNLRFSPPSTVYLLDLGLVSSLTDEDRITVARTLFAFATGDGPTVARLFYENSPHARISDYATYEAEISEFVAALQHRGLANVQLTLEIGKIFDILRRHRIQARSHMTMVNLALMTVEGLARRLAPELSLSDAALSYLVEALGAAGDTPLARKTVARGEPPAAGPAPSA